MLSARLNWDPTENELAAAARQAAARGDLVDLTETNPTRVGLSYPTAAIAAALARGAAGDYQPAPLGLPEARAAVARDYARAGIGVGAERLVLTASSSESYGFLFKLCCDPGDAVLVPEPSYPLFEYLARLEGVQPVGYRLAFDGDWHVDFASLDEALARAGGHRPRALIVVSPNNPTGSYLKRAELARLAAWCGDQSVALIADEVFAPYPFAPNRERVVCAAAAPEAAAAPAVFSLGGLSKACGLPHLKLGWIAAGGQLDGRGGTSWLRALELIADTYLSVSGPVQRALPELLAAGATIRAAITARVAENRAALAAALPAGSGCSLLPAEGGWSAILRVPASRSDAEWAISLAREAGVLVHPGYFFDMRGGAFLVVSLLPGPAAFATAIARLVAHVDASLR